MEQSSWEITAGLGAFALALVYLARRNRSSYFGLSILCVFMVSSASLAAYTHSLLFSLPLDWVTPSHVSVMKYSILGCLAMVAGLAIAWRKRNAETGVTKTRETSGLERTPWINPTFGWFIFAIGGGAGLLDAALHRLATVGTAVHALTSFSTFGLLVLLAHGLKTRRYNQLIMAIAIYAPIVLMQAFASGHTPAKVSLLIPAVCLIGGFRRIGWKSIGTIMICGFLFLAIMSGWMKTRKMIRGGELAQYSFVQKIQRFIPEWFGASVESALDTRSAHATIRDRVDMTDILAMQVRHQPRNEPFANGRTVLEAGKTLIPRALWPDKPVTAGGSGFVSKYTGMRRDPRDTTSIGLPYQFELYANGGTICVVAGLFVIGYICGGLERGLFTPTTNLASLLGRISITMTLCEGGQRTDVVLPALIAGGLTFFALGKLIESVSPSFTSKLLGASNPPRNNPASVPDKWIGHQPRRQKRLT